MSFTTIGGSLKSAVGENVAEYHEFVLAGGLIWAFARNYHKQESFNWGQRVVHKGGYGIVFDTNTNQWGEVKKFESLSTDENAEEILFELGGEVYLVLLANFGSITFQKLFKWSGTNWTEVALQVPEPITTEWKEARVTAHVVDDTSSTDKFIVVNMEHNMRLFKLQTDGNSASIQHSIDVPQEVNLLRGEATSAINTDSKLIISFMVMGCGVRWEPNRFIILDKASNTFEHVVLPDETSQNAPPFSFTGANGHGVAPNGDWIHAGGSTQVGMTGSSFEGSVWALKNLDAVPVWQRLPITIPAEIGGTAIVDSATGDMFLVGGEGVAKASLM